MRNLAQDFIFRMERLDRASNTFNEKEIIKYNRNGMQMAQTEHAEPKQFNKST